MVLIYGVFVVLNVIILVLGYGRFIDFVSWNLVWWYGFDILRYDIDNELNCGGFSV